MKRVFEWWWVILAGSIIALVVIPLTGSIVDLKITKAQFDLSSLQTALEVYKARHGSLPSEEDGLASLVGISLARVATEPWGNEYVYRRIGGGSHGETMRSPIPDVRAGDRQKLAGLSCGQGAKRQRSV